MNAADNQIIVLVELLPDDLEIENWEAGQEALEYCEELIADQP